MASNKLSVCILIGLLINVCAVAQDLHPESIYGLEFASHETTKDLRTSLNLNSENPFKTSGDFEVRFAFSMKRLYNTYGYVLRIVADDSINFDLVSSPETEGFHDFNFIVRNEKTNAFFDYEELRIQPLQWATIKIHFDAHHNTVSVSWNDKIKTHPFPVASLNNYRLFFGAHDFGKFKTADVPPMIIKDIRIKMDQNRMLEWKLREHLVNKVYDNTFEHAALTRNPTWLINRHTTWTHRTEFEVEKYPSIAFNSEKGSMYVSDIRGINELDVANWEIRRCDVLKGNVAYIDANQLLYVEETDELINYDLESNVYASFDFDNKAWNNDLRMYKQPHYWHNNKFYNPFDSTLYIFGGYGYFVYKNEFQRYNKTTHRWEVVEVNETIHPRYLSALGLTNSKSKAYIFGGYGSESGKQELSPQSYYDLYAFSLKDHHLKKIWDFRNHSDQEIVFSNSLIVDEADSCFYVLGFDKNKYHGHLQLRKYQLNEPSYSNLADSIPFQFHDEFSFADLFLSESTHELIAVTAHKNSRLDSIYTVNVYSIYYPPLAVSDVLQDVNELSLARSIYWVGGAALLLIAGVITWRTRRGKRGRLAVGKGPLQRSTIQPQTPMELLARGQEIINTLPKDRKIASTIFLFGDFQVFDKNGLDISSKFSATLRDLFILLILSSARQEKGISTTSLREYLWAEKDEVSARNNRNVNITKLRAILEEVGDIKIENTHHYVRLIVGEGVFCDFQIAVGILTSSTGITGQTVEPLLSCVKRGNLLTHLTPSWLDSYKSDVSNMVIDSLLSYSQKLDVKSDDHLLMEIADTIFKYDCINQEALVLKCSILNSKGKYSLAKNWYDHFAKEYRALYSENYPKTFEQVIS